MSRKQLNVRLPQLTYQELDWLKRKYGMSASEVVILAIDVLYHRDDKVSRISRANARELVELIASDQGVLDHE